MTIALDSDAAPNGYDPLLYSQGQFTFFSSVYDALFVTDRRRHGRAEPGHAIREQRRQHRADADPRDGVTFTDGSTAGLPTLVKANLDRRSDPDLAAYGSSPPVAAPRSPTSPRPTPKTVVITWAAPQASPEQYLADTAGVIVGKKGVDDPDSLETTPDGSGPYTLNTGDTTRASTYTFDKNAKAWNAAALTFRPSPSRSSPTRRPGPTRSSPVRPTSRSRWAATPSIWSSPSRRIVKNGGTIVGFPVFDKTGATNPAFGKVESPAGADLRDRPREAREPTCTPVPAPTSQLFPEAAVGFDPALDTE